LLFLCYPAYIAVIFADFPDVGMELFLNLCWLSLLLPAYLIWRRGPSCSKLGGRERRAPIFACALGCALVILFPVISASDDLHAMSAEMEESSSAKPSLCRASGERVPHWQARWQNLPAIVITTTSFGLVGKTSPRLFAPPLLLPAAPLLLKASRAPPVSNLA
jgi:hypothetical protein